MTGYYNNESVIIECIERLEGVIELYVNGKADSQLFKTLLDKVFSTYKQNQEQYWSYNPDPTTIEAYYVALREMTSDLFDEEPRIHTVNVDLKGSPYDDTTDRNIIY